MRLHASIMDTSPRRSPFHVPPGADPCLACEGPSSLEKGVITEELTSRERGSAMHGEELQRLPSAIECGLATLAVTLVAMREMSLRGKLGPDRRGCTSALFQHRG